MVWRKISPPLPVGSVRVLYDFQPGRENLHEFLRRRCAVENDADAFEECAVCIDRREDASELALPCGALLIVAAEPKNLCCGLILRCRGNGHLELFSGSRPCRGRREFQVLRIEFRPEMKNMR